ncbi:MAG TPA: serine/threonine protein kinase [Planctomycetaceae bacterium]|nr:serine/threonine protein kinase [Planctomycetaceae bacterium]
MPTGPESFDFLKPKSEVPSLVPPESAAEATAESANLASANAVTPVAPASSGERGRLGHYRILEVLGRGGMGQVFRAQDSRLKREVALKVMNKKFSATPNSRLRFLEEARAMAAIDDDNVVTIYEVGESDGTPFMAMELLKGETLERLTRSSKSIALDELIDIAKQLISGLSAAHRRGIIHRDVKPGNVWIESPSRRVKVLDFGLALASSPVDAFAETTSVIGTPGYLSPEQARGERLDDRSDLFSAGVVLYELACGKAPFVAKTISEQLVKILSHDPPRPDTIEPRVPRQVGDVIMRMLAKEPRDRFRSAAACVESWTIAAEAIEAEKRAAVQIVLDPTTHPSKSTGETGKRAAVSPADGGLWNDVRVRIVALVAAVMLLGTAGWLAFRGEKRIAQKPSVPTQASREPAVLASTLDVLTLSEIPAAPSSVLSGQQTRYRIVLANAASSDENDPRKVNANSRVIAQIATYLYPAKEPGQMLRGNRRSVAFPRKLSAAMLPAPGQNREFEIDFASAGITPGEYEVEFELQSPQGTPINRLATPLNIEENMATSDLVGFDRLRTSQNQGADTFVKRGSTDDFGGRPFIEIDHRSPSNETSELSHAYLRFDLSGLANRNETIGRAMLLMTLEPGGFKGKCTLQAYGVTAPLPQDWSEKGEKHLTWDTSPSKGPIDGYPFLGRIEFDNTSGQLEKRADELRLFGPGLDDYLRASEAATVTILLIRSSEGTAATKLVSREGNETEAPALAIRKRR